MSLCLVLAGPVISANHGVNSVLKLRPKGQK
ncbi:hypothetical protein CITRIK5_30214 [Citricoccus sp. K5]|nr:hypothetical protein CITRIK5_30214 [Citricoccus sp. K5]